MKGPEKEESNLNLGEKSPSLRNPLKERFLGREKLSGVAPLLVMKDSERNREILGMWKIPGTTIRVSKDGDIFYPVWRERTRINKPELYIPVSKLPRGWSLERLLKARKERLISEVIFYQVKKEGGSIEAAIRSMDHVLEQYEGTGKEMGQIVAIRRQIERAMEVLENSVGVSEEEFEDGFWRLCRQTEEIMENLGMEKAVLALKKEIDLLLKGASTGRDRTGRKNYLAVQKRLQAASRRVEYRASEIGFIVDKFRANKLGLLAERERERTALREIKEKIGFPSGILSHEAFKTGKTIYSQKGILVGIIGTMIYRLETVIKVKPYKTLALDIGKRLGNAIEKIRAEDFPGAKEILVKVDEEIKEALGNENEESR